MSQNPKNRSLFEMYNFSSLISSFPSFFFLLFLHVLLLLSPGMERAGLHPAPSVRLCGYVSLSPVYSPFTGSILGYLLFVLCATLKINSILKTNKQTQSYKSLENALMKARLNNSLISLGP